jgi:hypothetical protein
MLVAEKISRFLQSRATGRNILMQLILAVVSFVLMAFVFAPAFGDVTNGLKPLDLNFGIGAEKIYQDLPSYTDASRNIYIWFAMADFVFPATAAAFFSLLWGWLFNRAPASLFERLTAAGILLFPFLFPLIDWLENFCFLFVIFSYPAEYPAIGDLGGALKTTKPFVEGLILLGTAVFVVLSVRFRRSQP